MSEEKSKQKCRCHLLGRFQEKTESGSRGESSWALKGGRKQTPREEVKEEVGVREAGAWVEATQAILHEHRAHSSLPPLPPVSEALQFLPYSCGPRVPVSLVFMGPEFGGRSPAVLPFALGFSPSHPVSGTLSGTPALKTAVLQDGCHSYYSV